ncbi:MAG: hypothetical protein FWH01_01440 [Oscillospiraceae bacterium]|nr:hypothetical protein [Oscillospiraceae bacterium]
MIERLACRLGRNDEAPNIELAEYLCLNNDTVGIEEIVGGIRGKDNAVANDCIKVLYEIGERKPELIAAYANDIISCLRSKNNRLVWGGMTALAKIVDIAAAPIYARLTDILAAYETGSVITVDNSISVFAGLCKANESYSAILLPVLIRHFHDCKPKEVAQHAERASVCFNNTNAGDFIAVLETRKPHLTPASRARIEKMIKKLRHDRLM